MYFSTALKRSLSILWPHLINTCFSFWQAVPLATVVLQDWEQHASKTNAFTAFYYRTLYFKITENQQGLKAKFNENWLDHKANQIWGSWNFLILILETKTVSNVRFLKNKISEQTLYYIRAQSCISEHFRQQSQDGLSTVLYRGGDFSLQMSTQQSAWFSGTVLGFSLGWLEQN